MNSRLNSTIIKSFMSGAAIAALTAGSAIAQTDQIIVTATKRPQTLQEVPVAVSVVDAEVIENAQINDIIDLQSSVSSLRVTQQQNASQTNFIIRGFGNGANNPGIEPSVGVFIDGVYRSRSAAAILDLPTLERVEVLRGPQSTLFGKNVSAGAISLTTKAPSYDWEGSVEATVGNLGAVRFRGTLSGPISETLAFRVSGSTSNRNGTYENVLTGEDNVNERDRWAVRGQLLWEPTDTLSFRAIGDYNKIDEICCGAPLITVGPVTQGVIVAGLGGVIPPTTDRDARQVSVDQAPVNELTGKGVSLQGDLDLGFGTLTSITSYREQSDANDTDVDFTSIDLATQPQRVDYETFTQELRINGEFDTGIGAFSWLAGGFYFNEKVNFDQSTTFGDDFRDFGNILLSSLSGGALNFPAVEGGSQLIGSLTAGVGLPPGVPTLFPELLAPGGPSIFLDDSIYASGTGFVGEFELDNESYSLFFQTDWEISDRLTFTGGVSYTNDRKEAVSNVSQSEPLMNAMLSQFQTSGVSLEAARLLGANYGAPSILVDPMGYFGTVAFAAATDPGFAANRATALGTAIANAGAVAAGMAAPSPELGLGLGLSQLGDLQFIPMQTPFPAPGAIRDDEISLSDDGFAIDDAINVTARVAYDVTDSLNVYFNYSTGYKAPAVNLSQDAQPPVIGTNGLAVGRFAAAEDVTLYEIGFKANFNGGYINVALFDQTINNFQSNTFTGTGFVFANAGEQSVKGFEVDASYSPWDPLNLFVGVTYLDPEYPSFISFPCPSAGLVAIARADVLATCADPAVSTVDISGTDPSGIHPISLTTAATYTHEMANGSYLTGRVEYLYESETSLYELGNGTEPTRRVSTINANLKYEMENGFSVNVWGRNLNDDDALITFFPSVAQAGSYNAYIATPRTFGVSIRKDF